MLLTYRSRRVSSLLVVFGDGAGPVACSPSQARVVSYSQTGRKTITYTVYFTDGTQQQGLSALYFKQRALARSSLPLIPENVTALEVFSPQPGVIRGLYGAGEALVVLRNAQSQDEYRANPATYKLRKPIIILDGFDPQDESGLDTRDDKSFYRLVERAGILTASDQLERDVILLNFPNSRLRQANGAMTRENIDGGTDYVERNALVLVRLINQLKSRLASPTEKFAIIGPSMGGVVSRYALAYMEKKQYALTSAGLPADPQWDHNTALWITLDAPHQGANIPIGAQEFLRYFQNFSADAEDKFNTRINTTAAKQLLVHHHSVGANSVLGAPGYRDAFMLALRDNGRPGSLGYPELPRRVAIANGQLNGGGQQAGTACGTALHMDKIKKLFKFTIFRPLFFIVGLTEVPSPSAT